MTALKAEIWLGVMRERARVPANPRIRLLARDETSRRAMALGWLSGGLLRSNESLQKHIASLTPLGRYGVAEDVAGAISALVSEGNRFVTGQRIEVSGGIHL